MLDWLKRLFRPRPQASPKPSPARASATDAEPEARAIEPETPIIVNAEGAGAEVEDDPVKPVEEELSADFVNTDSFDLRRWFHHVGLGEHADYFLSLQRSAIGFEAEASDDSVIAIGQTKLGGLPDLPVEAPWPYFDGNALSFIAQINPAELGSFEGADQLPPDGLLSFFYDGESWGTVDAGGWQVLWTAANEVLERKEAPEDMGEFGEVYSASKLVSKQVQSMPHAHGPGAFSFRARPPEIEAYNEVVAQFAPDCALQIFGYPTEIQGEMEMECELSRNSVLQGQGHDVPRLYGKELRASFRDWRLLLQVDSVDESDMMWGDAGMLYFWIHQEDLAERRFENTEMILQCW